MARISKKQQREARGVLTCRKCGECKPLESYDSGRTTCKKCRLEYKRARYDPERQKLINDRAAWKTRARRYALSEVELRQLWALQGHKCAICAREVNSPHTDHDHATGKVRGLLCATCNRVLGMMQDTPDLLIKAAEYLHAGGTCYMLQREEQCGSGSS